MPRVVVEEVGGLLGRLAFLRAAGRLRREPQFTPDLVPEFLRQTSTKNPFFRNAEIAFFLARRGGEVVGRVAAVVDRRSNEVHAERVAAFGYFEARDGDGEATRALLEAAAAFGRERGMDVLRGPIDLSTNYRCGLLVEGHELPPAMLMPWNPPGHASLLEACGLRKAKDLVSMEVDSRTIVTERAARVASRALERGGYAVRSIDAKRLSEEVALIRSVYNAAWQQNWGFVPMTDEEIDFLAHGLKDVLIPEFTVLAEKDGEVVGFSLVLPDVAIPIREIGGRLLPFGWWRLLRWLKAPNRVRVLTLGVVEAHRRSGLDGLLYFEVTRRGLARGIHYGEFGWMLEDNVAILRGVEASGAKVTKRYRIYERPIA